MTTKRKPARKLTRAQEEIKAALIAHNYSVVAAASALGKAPTSVSRALNHRGLVVWWAKMKAKKKRTNAQARRRRRYLRDKELGKQQPSRRQLVAALEALAAQGYPVEEYLPRGRM